MIGGVCVAMFLVGVIIVLLAVTIRYGIYCFIHHSSFILPHLRHFEVYRLLYNKLRYYANLITDRSTGIDTSVISHTTHVPYCIFTTPYTFK